MTQSSPRKNNTIANSELPTPSNTTKRPIWEVVAEIGSQIPNEEWAKVPTDASINYKYYFYGAPRKDS